MIHNHLPVIMDQEGVSIRELSRVTGIAYTTIRAMYHGQRRSVQLEVLDAVCAALNVQPGDIYRWVASGVPIADPLPKRPAPAPEAPDRPQPRPSSRQETNRDWRAW